MTTVVWHIFGTMDVGGAELRTLALGREMRDRGYRFEYVALSGQPGALDDQIVNDGGLVHPMRLSPLFPVRFVVALRRHRPHVVDSHVATFSGAILLLARIAGVPVRIAHFRSDGDGHAPTLRRRLQRGVMNTLIRRCATKIVGVSPGALEFGYRPDWSADRRAMVIPNGLPRNAIEPHSARADAEEGADSRALHVGRPSPEKNRAMLPLIAARARERGWRGTVSLAGGRGTDADALAAAVATAGPLGEVEELGVRDDVLDLMAASDVLLLTSVREGLPGVVLEALSVGTPVISADLPGSRFIASHVPGVRIVTGSVDEWAEALMEQRRTSTDRRAEIARGFREGPFDLARVADAHEMIYQ